MGTTRRRTRQLRVQGWTRFEWQSFCPVLLDIPSWTPGVGRFRRQELRSCQAGVSTFKQLQYVYQGVCSELIVLDNQVSRRYNVFVACSSYQRPNQGCFLVSIPTGTKKGVLRAGGQAFVSKHIAYQNSSAPWLRRCRIRG